MMKAGVVFSQILETSLVTMPKNLHPSSAPRRTRLEGRTQDPPFSSLGQLGRFPIPSDVWWIAQGRDRFGQWESPRRRRRGRPVLAEDWLAETGSQFKESFLNSTVWPSLEDSDWALGLSQRGPWRVSRSSDSPFPCLSAVAGVAVFSTLLAITEQLARMQGFLGRRGWALESAAARVCREAGARCAHQYFRPRPGFGDAQRHWTEDASKSWWTGCRCTEGAQLAIDITAWH